MLGIYSPLYEPITSLLIKLSDTSFLVQHRHVKEGLSGSHPVRNPILGVYHALPLISAWCLFAENTIIQKKMTLHDKWVYRGKNVSMWKKRCDKEQRRGKERELLVLMCLTSSWGRASTQNLKASCRIQGLSSPFLSRLPPSLTATYLDVLSQNYAYRRKLRCLSLIGRVIKLFSKGQHFNFSSISSGILH